MQARALRDAHRIPTAPHVLLAGAGKPAHRAVLDGARHRLHCVEIAVAGSREAGFDHIHAHALELPRDAQLLFFRHRRAGALFAVAHRGVEYDQFFLRHGCLQDCRGSRPAWLQPVNARVL
ncbi:hypothetical protein D3C83_06480 [compost metagenome]